MKLITDKHILRCTRPGETEPILLCKTYWLHFVFGCRWLRCFDESRNCKVRLWFQRPTHPDKMYFHILFIQFSASQIPRARIPMIRLKKIRTTKWSKNNKFVLFVRDVRPFGAAICKNRLKLFFPFTRRRDHFFVRSVHLRVISRATVIVAIIIYSFNNHTMRPNEKEREKSENQVPYIQVDAIYEQHLRIPCLRCTETISHSTDAHMKKQRRNKCDVMRRCDHANAQQRAKRKIQRKNKNGKTHWRRDKPKRIKRAETNEIQWTTSKQHLVRACGKRCDLFTPLFNADHVSHGFMDLTLSTIAINAFESIFRRRHRRRCRCLLLCTTRNTLNVDDTFHVDSGAAGANK